MRRYGYRPNPNEYTCPNCPELFEMQDSCIVYSGTCDCCSTVFSAKRNRDGTISVHSLETHTYVTGRAFETIAVGIEISDLDMAQFDEGTPWGWQWHDSIWNMQTIGIIDETCASAEPLWGATAIGREPEPYKRSLINHKLELEASGMLDEFLKHYRGDYDG